MISEAPIKELKAVAHPLRFAIIQVLRAGERNVGEIEQLSGIGQPALSQQLGVLRKAELVKTRKEAKLVYYSLNEPLLTDIAALIAGHDNALMPKRNGARTPSPGAANFARLS